MRAALWIVTLSALRFEIQRRRALERIKFVQLTPEQLKADQNQHEALLTARDAAESELRSEHRRFLSIAHRLHPHSKRSTYHQCSCRLKDLETANRAGRFFGLGEADVIASPVPLPTSKAVELSAPTALQETGNPETAESDRLRQKLFGLRFFVAVMRAKLQRQQKPVTATPTDFAVSPAESPVAVAPDDGPRVLPPTDLSRQPGEPSPRLPTLATPGTTHALESVAPPLSLASVAGTAAPVTLKRRKVCLTRVVRCR